MRKSIACVSICGIGLGVGVAHAQPLYWDVNGVAPGASTIDGTTGLPGVIASGTWDATTPNWNTDPNGEATTVAWTPGEIAIFSAGGNGTWGSTITVSGTHQISG